MSAALMGPAVSVYLPYLVVVFIGVTALIATLLGRSRLEIVARAGAVLATGDAEVAAADL